MLAAALNFKFAKGTQTLGLAARHLALPLARAVFVQNRWWQDGEAGMLCSNRKILLRNLSKHFSFLSPDVTTFCWYWESTACIPHLVLCGALEMRDVPCFCGAGMYYPELDWSSLGFQRSWAHFSPTVKNTEKSPKRSPLDCVSWRLQSCSLRREELKPAVFCRYPARIAEQWMGAAAAASMWSTGAVADSHQNICYSQILA